MQMTHLADNQNVSVICITYIVAKVQMLQPAMEDATQVMYGQGVYVTSEGMLTVLTDEVEINGFSQVSMSSDNNVCQAVFKNVPPIVYLY